MSKGSLPLITHLSNTNKFSPYIDINPKYIFTQLFIHISYTCLFFCCVISVDFGCNSQSSRQRRSVDLQREREKLSKTSDFHIRYINISIGYAEVCSCDIFFWMWLSASDFQDAELQACCSNAFSAIPMKRTCEERAARVLLVKNNQTCVDAFLKCCKEAEQLRHKMKLDEARAGFGRSEIF